MAPFGLPCGHTHSVSVFNGIWCKPQAKTKNTKDIKRIKKTNHTKTNIRVATWNLVTMKGSDAELVETL